MLDSSLEDNIKLQAEMFKVVHINIAVKTGHCSSPINTTKNSREQINKTANSSQVAIDILTSKLIKKHNSNKQRVDRYRRYRVIRQTGRALHPQERLRRGDKILLAIPLCEIELVFIDQDGSCLF